MKKASLLFAFILVSAMIFAQNQSLPHLANIQDDGNWIKMLPKTQIQTKYFFKAYLSDLGLDDNNHFELINKTQDKLGYTHYRYRQHFKGIPVEGGTYILHEKDGYLSHGNGKLVRGIAENGQFTVSAEKALDIAKDYMNAESFYWENPKMEACLQHAKKDPTASFFPEAQLVFAESEFSNVGQDYKRAWKYELHSAGPDQRKTIFVDVVTGEVLFALEGHHCGAVEGEAKTRYHGVRKVITDSISPTEYRLVDATRGGGIETYDMNENVDDYSVAVDFVDDDNFWDNANDELDDAAVDAHWGAEMFYDYMLQKHERDSYDGNGSALVSYVHYDEDFENAFWNGSFVTYGDGIENPLVSIDVVAHEFTHGVTSTSARLIYRNESGALNESFSDIFGTAIEMFAFPEEANWLLGTENFVFRDMSNPNTYDHPDTYKGSRWFTGAGDNGGVHINSGVQNFWFYLLSEGGEGVNDHGDEFSVDSLGIEVAAAIAYRNLTEYLTESSNYFDARIGSLQAAAELYGNCSYEVEQVAKAWHAVGVGTETTTPDFQMVEALSPSESCDLGSSEQVSMNIRYNPSGCEFTLDPGVELEVSYKINFDAPVVETVVLTEMVEEGDIITHEFMTPADLSTPGEYFITYKMSYEGDLNASNNEIRHFQINKTDIFDGSNEITFEQSASQDSFYVLLGNNAATEINSSAANTGGRGFQMNSFGATPEGVTILPSDEGNFEANPNFVSKLCMCADLTEWENAFLNFDLRQTYSPLYLEQFGVDLSYMVGMRVTVDDVQYGEQFHPMSNDTDSYVSHVMDMNPFVGTSFTLCLESINFVNDDEDEDGIGDKSTLDNIFFSPSEFTDVDDVQLSDVNIYPNPTSGLLSVVLDEPDTYDLKVIDILGHVVKVEQRRSFGNPLTLDLSGLTKGVYMLSVSSEGFNAIEKIVLE